MGIIAWRNQWHEHQPLPSCQSCGLPIDGPSQCGTEEDGTRTPDYCNMCYEDGVFVEPDISMAEMKALIAGYLVRTFHIKPAEARRGAADVLPELRRWRRPRDAWQPLRKTG